MARITAPTFTIETTFDYIDARGYDREANVTIRYSYDGERAPKCEHVGFRCASDYDIDTCDAQLDGHIDDLIADHCDDDWNDWLASRDGELAIASGSTVPPVPL